MEATDKLRLRSIIGISLPLISAINPQLELKDENSSEINMEVDLESTIDTELQLLSGLRLEYRL